MTGLCRCGAPGVHPAGTGSLCAACFDLVLGDARARHLAEVGGVGFGRQDGPLRPDFGVLWADLRCCVCDATWVGPIGEDCHYCIRFLELQLDVQRTVLLHPDLPNDERRPAALRVWALRLADAVKLEIVSEIEARVAIVREEGRRVA